MTTTPRIILNNVSFQLDQTPVHFDSLNLSFEPLKYGIVGANGIGKTTFLKLLLGELTPKSGSIQRLGSIMQIPQVHNAIAHDASVSDVLGTSLILQALQRIHNGGVDEADFAVVADQWDIEQRIATAFAALNIRDINFNQLFHELSGGQKTKVLLAKTRIFNADFLIFDEPTNNLDSLSRALLLDYIETSSQGFIIVSHDRALLNQCERILEITPLGMEVYGGNYDFYTEQKELKRLAIEHEIQARSDILSASKNTMQIRLERHQKNEARGRKKKLEQIEGKGRYDKIEFKSKQGKSEQTNRRIRLQAERKLGGIEEELLAAQDKLVISEKLDVSLAATAVPHSKTVLKIEHLTFHYHAEQPILNHFNLHITGPDRVAVTGPNGCGKSTLIQLIRGLLTPESGTITVGVEHVAYLDQAIGFLDPELSLVDNFLKHNAASKPFDAYSALAAFKFRNKEAEKYVKHLSGGEKIRAALAITLMTDTPPQLIILDEPTNHLDLESIEAIESALKHYQGALLVISHDEVFLENINVGRYIAL